MPPVARKTSEKPVITAPVTEALADDVAAESEKFEPGTPIFFAHLEMPRLRRAEAFTALGAIQMQNRKTDTVEVAKSENGEVDVSQFGERYKIIGLIEEYLACVAVNEVEFRHWAMKIEDAVLIKTFNIYMRVNQPGEAKSSAS